MKSRITIDVDHDNQPIIKIEYSASEDVRDKLVKRFLETFGGDSKWAEFAFINGIPEAIHGQVNSTAIVRPITPHQLKDELPQMTYIVNEHEKMMATLPGHGTTNNGPHINTLTTDEKKD